MLGHVVIPRRSISRIKLRAVDCLQSVILKSQGTNALPLFHVRWLFWMLMWQPCVLFPLCDPERGQSISTHPVSAVPNTLCSGSGEGWNPSLFHPSLACFDAPFSTCNPPPPKKQVFSVAFQAVYSESMQGFGELCWLCSCLWTFYPKVFLNILIRVDCVLMNHHHNHVHKYCALKCSFVTL